MTAAKPNRGRTLVGAWWHGLTTFHRILVLTGAGSPTLRLCEECDIIDPCWAWWDTARAARAADREGTPE